MWLIHTTSPADAIVQKMMPIVIASTDKYFSFAYLMTKKEFVWELETQFWVCQYIQFLPASDLAH